VIQHSTLPALFGYESQLMATLPEGEQRQIERVCEAWLLSSVVLTCPLAYAAWLVEHSLLLSLLLGAGALFVVMNMLRLSIAGGGVPAGAQREQAERYRPALGATVVIGVLALLFAQPAQLPLWKSELDATVAAHREALIAQHDQALGEARGDARGDSYRSELTRCEFVVLRLTTIWKTAPTRSLQLTAFYVLLVLLPTLWARFVALEALQAFALARWRRDRGLIVARYRESDQVRDALLGRFPSYRARASAFADPPFETRVASPLLTAARQQPTRQAKRAWLAPARRRFSRAERKP
jgi:hypothetical protein